MDLFKPLIALLAIVNPIGAIPFFIAFTQSLTREQRKHTISVASSSAFVVIAVSAVAGLKIIEFFGISIASFQVGGGLDVTYIEPRSEGPDQRHSRIGVRPTPSRSRRSAFARASPHPSRGRSTSPAPLPCRTSASSPCATGRVKRCGSFGTCDDPFSVIYQRRFGMRPRSKPHRYRRRKKPLLPEPPPTA